MQLKKIFISGFKSISPEHPQTIEFETDVTTFIGHNGTGKSTVLEALNKLFSIEGSLRGINSSDFYLRNEEDKGQPKSLIIEAWFSFGNIADAPAIPVLINGLTACTLDGEIIFRVRLEATLNFEYNLLGDIDEAIWIVEGDDFDPLDENKHRLAASQRNAIQVTYIPANRDPLTQLKYSSKAVLGRLLKAIKWSHGEQSAFESQAQELNKLASENNAILDIENAINSNWKKIYKGRHLTDAALNFPVNEVDEILKLIQLQFMPDAAGNKVDTKRLSDGQRSLVYFALTKALFDIDKNTRQAIMSKSPSNFDADKMKLPIFSLIALEEPENHLSPHYLGRVINLIKDYGESDFCQAVVSSHSPSLVGRVDPNQIRHFRLDSETYSSRISSLKLPSDEDEQAKFISEAVKAYPEIYFAKLVVLGEGDSEQVILPRLLEYYDTDIDAHSISVVPLGGRHVNHFWRLLDSIKVPFVTLLDFDIDRNGGGFGRMKYAIEQVEKVDCITSTYIHSGIVEHIPKWNSAKNPSSFALSYDGTEGTVNIVNELEKCNVFFSSPLDIDFSLISTFPDVFCEKDLSYGERGPTEGKEDEEDTDTEKRQAALIKAVLKKGNTGRRFNFGEDWEKNFLWYRYRFLSNKSKPASHIRMLKKIDDKYSNEEIKKMLPSELGRLLNRISELGDKVIE